MDSLKNKLEKNIKVFNAKPDYFNLKKEEIIKTNGVYERFVNWVTGEFDLNLKHESEILKVYFPNGWFSIVSHKNENEQEVIKINVKGKSKIACVKIMSQLEHIYNHVVYFQQVKIITALNKLKNKKLNDINKINFRNKRDYRRNGK
ncbi:hypothetical protein GCM10023314_30110 [Algibacter agarivorans]|uniref:Uncharacterized protein n=1 Tax=Algibacter agarivorans TaxID=1109741 RepID=A0ABP9GXP1_9FLAO